MGQASGKVTSLSGLSTGGHTLEEIQQINYISSSPSQLQQQLPPPLSSSQQQQQLSSSSLSQRPSITDSITTPLDSLSSKTNDFETYRVNSYQSYNDTTYNDTLISKCNFQEQEPLLSTTNKISVGSL
uniref:Uncharacterized protein n=1 Tax=Wuchereria bancrofti TaxID=6293 RepID=A0AAF5Q5G2_WUCBA